MRDGTPLGAPGEVERHDGPLEMRKSEDIGAAARAARDAAWAAEAAAGAAAGAAARAAARAAQERRLVAYAQAARAGLFHA